MSPKGSRHEALKIALTYHWVPRTPPHIRVAGETTFRLSPDTYVEPDFLFFDKAAKIDDLSVKDAHLVVELANPSFPFDIGKKAKLYARFGIPELWVIHAVKLETHIHRQPTPEGYGDVKTFRKDQELRPAFAPELAVRLADLDL
jgi:Uma2 family endonuclease